MKRVQTYYFIFIIIGVCIYFSGCKSSEVITPNEKRDVSLPLSIAKIDKLGNVFLLDRNNQITLFTKNLDKKYEYADNTLGKITHVDVTNPLKIIIYKKDYGLVIVLDNTLAEINRLNLFEMGFQGVSVVATAQDGNLWIYDTADYKLKKISRQGKILLESMNMVELGLQRLQPDLLQERMGKLVVKDPDAGIILFDNLGQWIQTFPFKVEKDIQFDGRNIIFPEEDQLVKYDTKLFEEIKIPLQENKVTPLLMDVKIGLSHYYYIYKDGVDLIAFSNEKIME